MVTIKKAAMVAAIAVSFVGTATCTNKALLKMARDAVKKAQQMDPNHYTAEAARNHVRNAKEYQEKMSHELARALRHEIKRLLKQIYKQLKLEATTAKEAGNMEEYAKKQAEYKDFKDNVYNYWRDNDVLPSESIVERVFG